MDEIETELDRLVYNLLGFIKYEMEATGKVS